MLVWAAVASAHNKAATWQLMSGRTIGEVEHTLTEKDHAVLYQPVYRLAFSIYANELTASQVQKLVAAADKVRVDSCSFTSPDIVLIIEPHVRVAIQALVYVSHEVAGITLAVGKHYLRLGVVEQHPYKFAASVAGSS